MHTLLLQVTQNPNMFYILLLGIFAGAGAWLGKIRYQAKLSLFKSILAGAICSYVTIVPLSFFGVHIGPAGISILAFLFGYLIIAIIKRFEKSTTYSNTHNIKTQDISIEKNKLDNFIINITETDTSYEIIGKEHRIIDNSNNNGHVRRKMTISREWKKTYSFSENANSSNENFGRLSFHLVELGLKISNVIENKYEFHNMETKNYSEEIELDILPHSKIVLEIDWKIIWQNGLIELSDSENNIVFYPYRVAKGLTFDQTQRKTN